MASFVTIYPSDLEYAVQQGTITEKQSAQLWPELKSRAEKRFTTTLEDLGYVSGALLIIGSLTWFTSLAYENKDSLALFYLGLFYVFGFGSTGLYFWHKTTTDYSKIVGGIFLTVAVSVSPVATFALDRYYDWSLYLYRGSLEASTLAGFSLIALALANFSPLLIPLNISACALVGSLLVPVTAANNHNVSNLEFCLLGLATLVVGYSSTKIPSYSFWFYLFGLFEFCGSLTAEYNSAGTSETFKITFFLIHLALFASALPLNQAMFFLFGGYGICLFTYEQLQTYGNQTVDCCVTAAFGAIIIISAYVVDRRNVNSDYPFWAYLFGVGMFESAITWLFQVTYGTEESWYLELFYFALNVGLTVLYIPTQRWQFILGGTFGVLAYTNWLLYTYAASYALPIMITLVGLSLIGFAVWLGSSKIVQARRLRHAQQEADQEQLL
eukprot:TRINITY_DN5172_c0_g1_i1.p1 TRINITY_DN5172_c0_g1~~TRINITY_DN5172_c0_g1_i1.p1  ORF type:complete len:441 (-),score=77.29 TRINITY_DN5172_c0_g1_i1:150-1472(-)